MLKKGTVVKVSTGFGCVSKGFIVGTCAYDGGEKGNAYVLRYVMFDEEEQPRKPYTVVAFDKVEPIKNLPKKAFMVAGHWIGTPEDKNDKWDLNEEDGNLIITPKLD